MPVSPRHLTHAAYLTNLAFMRSSARFWAPAVLIVLATIGVLCLFRGLIGPLSAAFLMAYMADPVIDRLEKYMPRSLGIAVLLGVTLLALMLGVVLILPPMIADFESFFKELPNAINQLITNVISYTAQLGIPIPHSAEEAIEQIAGSSDSKFFESALSSASTFFGGIIGGTASAISVVVNAGIIPVVACYLLYDFDRMMAGIRQLIPARSRNSVGGFFSEVDDVIGHFIRGQLLVMFILAVLYAIGYSLVGVRLAIPIAIIAGLVAFIPYLGGAVGLGLALLMCLVDWSGWGQIGGVVVVFGIIQFLEGFVISPFVLGDRVGLSSIWVLLAILAFGDAFGIVGILFAVPIAAVLKIVLLRLAAAYRASDFYRSSTSPLDYAKDEDTKDGKGDEGAARPVSETLISERLEEEDADDDVDGMYEDADDVDGMYEDADDVDGMYEDADDEDE